jgi:glycosyltransferase involved in cell wall biosynthesis
MHSKKRLLFFGELPPTVYHGISISNERILSALSADFYIYKVEDKSSFGSSLRALFSFFISQLKLMRFSYRNVDVYYLNAPMSYLGLWKVYFSILIVKVSSKNVKVVAHLHRGDFLEFIKNTGNKRLFERFSSQLDKLLVLSKSSELELTASNLIKEHKIEILHNTVVLSALKNFILNTSYDIVKEQFYYCLCNYIPTKRIHNLVGIVNEILVIKVKFNGASASENYMQDLKSLDVNSLCCFDGVINGYDKEKRLQSSKALILPSLNEGMPLVILESLAQGTPVICFDIGYISDYVGEDYPGLVTVLTDRALKEKIEWLNQLSNNDYLSLRKLSFDVFWKRFDPKIINLEASVIFNKF